MFKEKTPKTKETKNSKMKKLQVLVTFGATLTCLFATCVCFAASSEAIMQFAFSTIGKLALIPAAIVFIMGLIAMGQASEEGDGPAKAKAKKQLSGGIIIAAVAVIIMTQAGTIAALFAA